MKFNETLSKEELLRSLYKLQGTLLFLTIAMLKRKQKKKNVKQLLDIFHL